jgi:hypothetical protein
MVFEYGSGNPAVGLPTSSGAGSIANEFGVDMSGAPVVGGETKVKKSGTYTRTYDSSTIPDDTALVDKINKIFKQYYGRDANQSELAIWLPQLKNQYKAPSGKSKTTIKETYKNGQLVDTQYLTADNADPAVWLDTNIKGQLVSGKQAIGKGNIPEGPSGKFFTEFKNFAAKNGIMLSDSAAIDYANKAVAGVVDADTIYSTLRESAASAFPQLADKIKSGIDLRTLADPYIQSMSNLLEIPTQLLIYLILKLEELYLILKQMEKLELNQFTILKKNYAKMFVGSTQTMLKKKLQIQHLESFRTLDFRGR